MTTGQVTTTDAEASSFDRPQPFTMLGTAFLSEGRSSDLLATTDGLWVHAKVYSDGGERGLHAHPEEDHIFFVLAGSATFRNADNETSEVGPYCGILIPKGVLYAFESNGGESLVIIRIGAGDTKHHPTGMKAQGFGGKPAKRPGTGVPIPGVVLTAPKRG